MFLSLLGRRSVSNGVEIHGYCLMTNHYHLIVRAEDPLAISMAAGQVNREYSLWKHGLAGTKGQLWEGRFGSCVLDDAHYWAALRYVEQNPVTAGLVERPWDWPWSSARAHLGGRGELWLNSTRWTSRFDAVSWGRALDVGISGQAYEERLAIRKFLHQENPVTRHRG